MNIINSQQTNIGAYYGVARRSSINCILKMFASISDAEKWIRVVSSIRHENFVIIGI